MALWFNNKKKHCSADDARFLILLCLGREPYLSAECDVYADMSVFGALKRIIASRPFGQTLFDVFTLGKQTMRTALNDDQRQLTINGLRNHFDVKPTDTEASAWPGCLLRACESRRFQKAFLSEHSHDRFLFLKDNLAKTVTDNDECYVGAVHQTADLNVRGIAYRHGQTVPLTLDFYLNGQPSGTVSADQINREVGEHLSADGLVAFDTILSLPNISQGNGDAVLHVFDHATGIMVCPPREMCLAPQYGAALLARAAHTIDTLRTSGNNDIIASLNDLADRLPTLEQISAFSLKDYDLYQRIYAPGPPQIAANNVSIGIVIEGPGGISQKRTRASIQQQTHQNHEVLDVSHTAITGFDLIITLQSGDELDHHALAWFAATAQANPDAKIIRASSDVIGTNNTRTDPSFIWKFDPLILKQNPSYARTFAVRPAVLAEHKDSTPVDLWLSVYSIYGDTAFAEIAAVIWSRSSLAAENPQTLTLSKPDTSKKLAVIIPTKDALSLLKPCVESLCRTLEIPLNTEIIIVDNNSEDDKTKEWLSTVSRDAGCDAPTIRVIEDPQPFNWAAINNNAAHDVDADYLLFLNNDTLAVDAGWDTALRSLLETDGIGVVGAKLLYEDDTIQHAGVILEDTSLAVHEGAGDAASDAGYAHRNVLTRRCSAVTGAFLACTKDAFDAVGGFDAENFAVTFNDIDFCLRMNAAGHQCVYSPLVIFYHLESKSRGYDGVNPEKAARAKQEHEILKAKWQKTIPHDPWYPRAFEAKGHKPFKVLRPPKRNSVI